MASVLGLKRSLNPLRTRLDAGDDDNIEPAWCMARAHPVRQ